MSNPEEFRSYIRQWLEANCPPAMRLLLDQELKESARGFFTGKAPVAQLRELLDNEEEPGFKPEFWRQMVAMGWASIAVPEAFGGFGYGYAELGVILEENGRTLSPSPLIGTVLLGATALTVAGSLEQKKTLLPGVCGGRITFALALEEGVRHAPYKIETRLMKGGDGYILEGKKQAVIDGASADRFLVSARLSATDEVCMVLVDAGAPGVYREKVRTVDGHFLACIRFEGVKIDADAMLGCTVLSYDKFERILDIARAGLAAELLGIARQVTDLTLDYLKQRKQFGVAIGSFQALQHRMADLFCEIELCKSGVLAALQAIDSETESIAVSVSLAKAQAGVVAKRACCEAIQMHGGIGVTDELDLGLYLKRCQVLEQLFGDDNFHLDRFASLSGF